MRQCAARNEAYLALPCLSKTLKHPPSYSWDALNISFAWHGSLAGQVAFSVAVFFFFFFFCYRVDSRRRGFSRTPETPEIRRAARRPPLRTLTTALRCTGEEDRRARGYLARWCRATSTTPRSRMLYVKCRSLFLLLTLAGLSVVGHLGQWALSDCLTCHLPRGVSNAIIAVAFTVPYIYAAIRPCVVRLIEKPRVVVTAQDQAHSHL